MKADDAKAAVGRRVLEFNQSNNVIPRRKSKDFLDLWLRLSSAIHHAATLFLLAVFQIQNDDQRS